MADQSRSLEALSLEHELAKYNSRAVQNSPVTIACVDANLRYTWVHNPHPDFAPSGAIGKRDDELAIGPGAQILAAIKRRVLAEGVQLRHVLTLDLSDGAHTYDITVTRGNDDTGRVTHLFLVFVDITQQVQTEEARRESDARYRSLFEQNHSVMMLIDRETGAIFDANPAAAAFYGWSREKLRAMNLAEINLTPAAELMDEMRRPPEDQRHHYFFQHRLADGSIRDVEVYRGPLPLAGRSLLYSITHDITERRQFVDALRSSEMALKRSQEVAHIGHWSWDTRRNTVSWSDEMKRIFGLDPQTFAGDLDKVIDHAIHPDDAARIRAMNTAVIDEQRPAETEYRVVWPDGSVHHVRAIPADSTRDEQGNILLLWGVVQDITERNLRDLEREQLLQQLEDKAEQLQQVMRSVPEGVLLLDNVGRVLLANPRAEQMLALLAAYGATPGDEQRLVQLGGERLDALLTSPPPGQWHTMQVGQQSFEAFARPVESGPVPAGWAMVLREVTAERMLQEQLQRQERLAAVGQLAAGIAHDFNNIMSVISIYAELTSELPGLTEKERARTLTIVEQTGRATRMIRQILDFSRQSVFERQALDLLPLLKEQVKLLTQTLPESVELDLYAAPGEYFVLADPTRMQQLVMNLAVNARDAMLQGGQLRITLDKFTVTFDKLAPIPAMAEGEWVRMVVQDTGTGIRPEHLTHIFEPFFTTKAPGKGTGLGLAQAHGIVAQHDGHIVVSSDLGIGTTFTIYLPALASAVPAVVASGLPDTINHGHGELVLVVEDEAVLRASLVSLLEDLHYRVTQAANGEEALARIAAEPVDLVLSDVVMPRLGGVALLKLLRQRGIPTPVILMSGHPMGEESVGLEAYGLSAWLDKPPSREQLAGALKAALVRGTGHGLTSG